MSIKSLCILRLSAIGDVCHAVAMVERVQRMSPETHITWVIGKLEHQLVGDIPGVEFIIFDKKQGKQAYRDLKEAMKGRRFAALFVMQVALRANLAARLITADVKVGFDWARSKELHWWFANKRIAPQQHAHVLEGFMAFADAVGIPDGGQPRWHIPIPQSAQDWADQTLSKHTPVAVISPAASKAERNWLPERYAAVGDYLQSRGMTVVLTGGPGTLDKTLGEAISSHMTQAPLNLIGQTSLKQMLAVLQQAELVVAPDTGPAHMATTVSTPVVGLYAHSNPRRTGPYHNLDTVASVYDEAILRQKEKDWTELPWGTRAKGEHLMEEITVEQVQAQIASLIE